MPEWFADGLQFRCRGRACGDCCSGKHGAGAVWVGPEEMQALARHLGLAFDDFTREYVRRIGDRYSLIERPELDCVFYEPGQGCSVYAVRPVQCRTYPFWPAVLVTRAAWEAESRSCPGINRDDVRVCAAEIRTQLEGRRDRAESGPPGASSTSPR